MTHATRLRAALFLPCVAFVVVAIVLDVASPAPTWGLWLIRHAVTLASGLGAVACWPGYLEAAR